jgi:hypothetical protein
MDNKQIEITVHRQYKQYFMVKKLIFGWETIYDTRSGLQNLLTLPSPPAAVPITHPKITSVWDKENRALLNKGMFSKFWHQTISLFSHTVVEHTRAFHT